jgi:phosphatidylglycerol:prolipoprotein diacylglycerol transferase
MLIYPEPDPVLLSIGSLKIHWYGFSYLAAMVVGWLLARWRVRRNSMLNWKTSDLDDLLFYVALGVVIGARIGYILFYDLGNVRDDPLRILRVWEGGMSFHGGMLGVILAMWLYARKHQRSLFSIADFITPLIPIGLFSGRVANFINAELWGAPTDLAIGMQVRCDLSANTRALCERVGTSPDGLMSVPVHASQLYEAALEGVVLFLVLWLYSAKPRPLMAVSGLFLLGYGIFRFGIEFIRMPDAHIGYLAGDWFTMGMLLTLPMIAAGLLLLTLAYNRRDTHAAVS